MRSEKTIIKELESLVAKSLSNDMKKYGMGEEISKEAIELIQRASKSNVGYTSKIVPIDINGEKCFGIEVYMVSEVGYSLDGDKVPGYRASKTTTTVPIYEKDRVKLENTNIKKSNKKFENLARIGKEYFDNGAMPREVNGWKEHLNNNMPFSLMEQLEKLIDAIQESDAMGLNNEKAAIFLEKYIDAFLKEEKKIKKEKENYDNSYKASQIRDRLNNIAKKYFKSGWPGEYGIESALRDPDVPVQLKEKMKDIASMSSKVSNLPLEEYYFKLEPLINDFYLLESELEKNQNKDLNNAKENYKMKSLLEKIRERLGKNKNQENSMKM